SFLRFYLKLEAYGLRPLLIVIELITARRQVLEARVLAHEGQARGADGAVTLLADDDFGNALVLGFRVIHLVPVDEHDDVGVLLDSTGLAQVGVHRTLVGALFQRAVKLRQGDHRAVEFLGQGLERAGYFRDLVDPVVAAGARDTHQLQVVDHDHADLAVLTGQSTAARAHFRG